MSKSILTAEGLSKSYATPHKQVELFHALDFSIAPGQSISIRGESGCGKTTLLNILSGLENPDTGALSWQDNLAHKKSRSWQTKYRAKHFGFIFQAYYLIPELSALENILMAARLLGPIQKQHKARAHQLLDQVQLAHRGNHLSPQLSGGERQRVAIARALMNEPAIIFADEPTGNLDEDTGERVIRDLLELCETNNTALILVTHNSDFAKRTQKELTLSQGKLSEC